VPFLEIVVHFLKIEFINDVDTYDNSIFHFNWLREAANGAADKVYEKQ
jgi:hypothetical protein